MQRLEPMERGVSPRSVGCRGCATPTATARFVSAVALGLWLGMAAQAVAQPARDMSAANAKGDAASKTAAVTNDAKVVDEILVALNVASDSQQIDAALDRLKRLADRGSTLAARRFGQFAAAGQYRPADPVLAERYLRMASRKGDADAQYALATFLLAAAKPDDAADRRRAEAVDWLRRSAKVLPESVYALAMLQAQSAPDPKLAEREVVRKAAEVGYAPALYRIAAEQLKLPPEQERDRAAMGMLQRAADQGHAVAASDLGILLLAGARVERDATRAVALLERAAARGDARAEYALGRAYMFGEGLPQNAAKGIAWVQRAAAKRLPEAEYALGFAFMEGLGVPADAAQALAWFHRSAAQSHADALFAIGNAYSNGYAVPKDPAIADQWYCKAAKAGHAPAIARMKLRPPGTCELPAS